MLLCGCKAVSRWLLGDCLKKGKWREMCRHIIKTDEKGEKDIKRQPWSILHGHFNSQSKSLSVFKWDL